MIGRERTVQQLDPLGGMSTRRLTVLGGAGLVGFVIVMTWFNREDIHAPVVTALGIAMVASAAIIVAIGSSPLRAPLRRPVHMAAMALGVIGMIFNAASMWESNRFIRDDWGPVAIGFISLLLSTYRPPRELATVATVAAIIAGIVGVLQWTNGVANVPPIVFVLVTVTPILAFSLGGAAFSATLTGQLLRWGSRASSAVRALSDDRLVGITRSVQQDRVTILNRDVVPFFADVLHRAEVLDADRATAARIADAMRRLMVAEVDRSWLDLVLEQAAAPGRQVGSVHDDDHVAAKMDTKQRIALRAAIVAIVEHPGFGNSGLDIRITRRTGGGAVVVNAIFARGDWNVRTDLAPYLAVLRVVFPDLHVDSATKALTLRFSYDEH